MNLFGLEICIKRKNNPGNPGNYVTEKSCEQSKEAFGQRITALEGYIDTRFEDFKEWFRNGSK